MRSREAGPTSGLRARIVPHLERRLRDRALAALHTERPDVPAGPALVPCHLDPELHRGLWLRSGDGQAIAAYRCEGGWYGREVAVEDARALSGCRDWLSHWRAHRGQKVVRLSPTLGGAVFGRLMAERATRI